jgi:serine/threonine protein kinase
VVIFNAILERAPLPALRLNPDMPPKLEDIINQALEKDRDVRYQHASDIRTDLKRLKRDADSGTSSITQGRFKARPKVAAIAISLCIIVACAATIAWWKSNRERAHPHACKIHPNLLTIT